MLKRFLLLPLLSLSFLSADIRELANIQDLCEPIADALEHEKLPLVVFDIDDTILTTDLVSNAWFCYELQRRQNELGADKELVRKKMIALYVHLQLLVPFKAVEEETPAFIAALQFLSIPCMALTTRSLDAWLVTPVTLVERTFQQLLALEIDFNRTAPSEKDLDLLDNPEKPVHYQQGILFNGQNNKGETLLKYLQAIDYQPDMVIFIDDSAQHVQAVHDAVTAAGIPCIAFRYTVMDEVTKNFDPARTQADLEAFLHEHPQSTAIA